MAGCISMMIIILFFLIFYMNTVPVTAANLTNSTLNTTQFDNFTVEWEDFNLLTCAVPVTVNVSLFACFPSATYGYIDDMLCLNETTILFDQNICLPPTTVTMYTSSYPITTQQMTTMASLTTKIQTLTSMTSTKTQSTTTTTSIITTKTTTTTTTAIITSNGSTTTGTTLISTTTTAVTTNTSTTTITNSNSTTGSTTTAVTGNNSLTTTTTTASYGNATTTTTTASNIYSCSSTAYIGTYCNVSSDVCAMSQPCYNAATCFPNNTLPYGYYCQCQTGYAGYNCQQDERACMENTCWNNGTCIPVNTTVTSNNGSNFQCECVEGFDGVYCELHIDLCGNITCQNKGMCLTIELMWKCICLDSTYYYGDYCQFKTNKLKIREILSKSFASIAIGVIVTTCAFVVIMDILKYAFHIDPVECERESYRKRLEERRRARRPIKNYEPKLALRFQYVS